MNQEESTISELPLQEQERNVGGMVDEPSEPQNAARLVSPAVLEYKARLQARESFLAWCELAGYKPAKHHRLIIAELQAIVDKLIDILNHLTPELREQEIQGLRLMVLMPPGTAKSTYISKLFPPWFLAQLHRIPVKELGILACSHEAGLATGFGKAARNLVEGNARWLGYNLKKDSRAAEQWETTNGGTYQAAGVGAGIAGRRAHLGVIDDFCGSQTDSMSKLFNDTVWNWYINDFCPRLQPFAARVIIANHRNEDDLVGRLLAKEPTKWRVIRLRLLIETEEQAEQDPLGRAVGDYIWPEYFTRQQVVERMQNPYASGIEQQEPAPLKGAFFNEEWFQTYQPNELPALDDCICYAASDHAVRTNQQNDNSCLGVGRYCNGILYIDPDLVWDKIPSNRAVKEMIRLGRAFKPMYWWAEKENISGSIGPFLKDQMQAERMWIPVIEVPHRNKDLMSRCQSIHSLLAAGRIRFPGFAPWFQRAKREMLNFPNGKHDDFVSFMAHLGQGIANMVSTQPKKETPKFEANQRFVPTLGWLKDSVKRKEKLRIAALVE